MSMLQCMVKLIKSLVSYILFHLFVKNVTTGIGKFDFFQNSTTYGYIVHNIIISIIFSTISTMHCKSKIFADKTSYENDDWCEHVREEVTNTTDNGEYDDKGGDNNSTPN